MQALQRVAARRRSEWGLFPPLTRNDPVERQLAGFLGALQRVGLAPAGLAVGADESLDEFDRNRLTIAGAGGLGLGAGGAAGKQQGI